MGQATGDGPVRFAKYAVERLPALLVSLWRRRVFRLRNPVPEPCGVVRVVETPGQRCANFVQGVPILDGEFFDLDGVAGGTRDQFLEDTGIGQLQ